MPAAADVTAAAATQPSQSSSVSSQQIRTWLDQLADRDAQIRDRATQDLMGLRVGDLPTLLSIVKDSRPLRPSQTTVLRDIVTHVYISARPYDKAEGNLPFLGVSWMDSETTADGQGLAVGRRIPGFAAYRMLRDGDIIVAIEERPGERFDTTLAFSNAIQAFQPGQTITLKVLRDGKPLRVRVTLRVKPIGGVDQINTWVEEQQASADQYWDSTFGLLVGDTLS